MKKLVTSSKQANTSIFTKRQPARGFGLESSHVMPKAAPQQQTVQTKKPRGFDFNRISMRPQAKLTVNKPGDAYEQEADRVAQQVVQRMNNPQEQQTQEHQQQPKQSQQQEKQIQTKSLADSITSLVQRQQEPEKAQEEEQEQEETVQAKSIDSPVQRQQEPEKEEEEQKQTVQAKSINSPVQRQQEPEKEEEEQKEQVQAKSIPSPVQRQQESEKEEEEQKQTVQAKSINSPVQRQQEPEKTQQEQQEETVQAKSIASPVQRQQESEKTQEQEQEETVQAKSTNSVVQRLCDECEKELEEEKNIQTKSLVQQKSAGKEKDANAELESSISEARGDGQPMADNVRQPMEEAIGADFSGVRIHTGSRSDGLNKSIQAKAFTTGQDVFFGQGEYSPETSGGKELLAHELTHVVQQNGGGVRQKSPSNEAAKKNKVQTKVASTSNSNSQIIQPKQIVQKEIEQEKQGESEQEAAQTSESQTQEQQLQAAPSKNFAADIPTPPDDGGTDGDDTGNTSPNDGNGLNSLQAKSLLLQRKSAGEEAFPEDEQLQDIYNFLDRTSDQPNLNLGEDHKERVRNPTRFANKDQWEKEYYEKQKKADEKLSKDERAEKSQQEEQKSVLKPLLEEKNNGDPCSAFKALENLDDKKGKNNNQKYKLKDDAKYKLRDDAEQNTQNQKYKLRDDAEQNTQNQKYKLRDDAEQNTESPAYQLSGIDPKIIGEKEEATAAISEARKQADNINDQTQQLVSGGVNFASSPNQQNSQQETEASQTANDFLTAAASQIQTITQLSQGVEERIQGSVENTKATVMAAVEEQKANVSSQIKQQRNQVQEQAEESIKQIEEKHLSNELEIIQIISLSMTAVNSESKEKISYLDKSEESNLERIDKAFDETRNKYFDVANKVGDQVIDKGKERYENSRNAPPVTALMSDENLRSMLSQEEYETHEREVKKADDYYAEDVAEEYKQSFLVEAEKQSFFLDKQKEEARSELKFSIDISRQQIKCLQHQIIKGLKSLKENSLSAAKEAKTELIGKAKDIREDVVEFLDQQEDSLLRLLDTYGNQQVSVIERDGQKAISSIQNGINSAASNLHNGLQQIISQIQGIETPNSEELATVLAEIRSQVDSSIADVQEQTQLGVTEAENGINQGQRQVVDRIAQVAETGIEESSNITTKVTDAFDELNSISTDHFKEIRKQFTDGVTQAESERKKIDEIAQGAMQKAFDMSHDLSEELANNANETELEDGFWDAYNKNFDSDVKRYAEEKRKNILITVIVTIVSIGLAVIAGFIIGAIATIFAAKLIALSVTATAAKVITAITVFVLNVAVGLGIGVIGQVITNALNGDDLGHDMEKALIHGAISSGFGALGSSIRVVKNLAGNLSSLLFHGVEFALEAVGDLFGNLAAGEPITLESILIGATIGKAFDFSFSIGSKLNKIESKPTGNTEGITNNTLPSSQQFDTNNRINTDFDSTFNTPSFGSQDIDMPGVRTTAGETPRSAGVDTNQTTADSSPRNLTQQGGDSSASSTTTPMNTSELGGATNQPTADSRSGDTAQTPKSADTNTAGGSKSDTNTPDAKQPEVEGKASDTTSNQRSTHHDEPEIEPGVVAKQKTDDGHEIKVIKDGRIVRCSTCEEIRQRYNQVLEEKPELKQRLDEIEKKSDPQEKSKQVIHLVRELDNINSQKAEQTPTNKPTNTSGFKAPEHSTEAQFYRYDSKRVTGKNSQPEFDVETNIDQLGRKIIQKLEYSPNRDPFSAQTKKDVHQLANNTDYQQYSNSPKNNVEGNDFRHIKSNLHTKLELSRMYEGQPVEDVLQHLKARKFLPDNATEKDLGKGIWRQYREEADNPNNLPPGPGKDNQRIGRISDRLRKKYVDMGKEKFEKTDMTIRDSELLNYLGIDKKDGYRVESYDELMGLYTQLIYDAPIHGDKGEYYNSLQEARPEVDFPFYKRNSEENQRKRKKRDDEEDDTTAKKKSRDTK